MKGIFDQAAQYIAQLIANDPVEFGRNFISLVFGVFFSYLFAMSIAAGLNSEINELKREIKKIKREP